MVGAIYHLLSLSSLDGLSRKEIKFKKKKKKKRKKKETKGLTMARSFFKLRNTSCFLVDLRSAMSVGSSRDCSTIIAMYPTLPY